MSYKLIKVINRNITDSLLPEIFPFQYGTVGSFLSSLMIPFYGTGIIGIIEESLAEDILKSEEEPISTLESFLHGFNNSLLTEVSEKIFSYVRKDFFGSLKSFFQAEVWVVDSKLTTILSGYEEVRDSLLLFVFSVPVMPVSHFMKEVLTSFHIFEPDEHYNELQSILNDFFTETPRCQRSYLSWKMVDSMEDSEREDITLKLERNVPFICDGCGKDIKGVRTPFISRVEIYPSRNTESEYDNYRVKDYEQEISSILENAGVKPEKEVNRSVWTEYRLFLCNRCRNTFIKRIENGEFI